MLNLKGKAPRNEELAYAIVGQALLDEASKRIMIIGRNIDSVKEKRKNAFVWSIVPSK